MLVLNSNLEKHKHTFLLSWAASSFFWISSSEGFWRGGVVALSSGPPSKVGGFRMTSKAWPLARLLSSITSMSRMLHRFKSTTPAARRWREREMICDLNKWLSYFIQSSLIIPLWSNVVNKLFMFSDFDVYLTTVWSYCCIRLNWSSLFGVGGLKSVAHLHSCWRRRLSVEGGCRNRRETPEGALASSLCTLRHSEEEEKKKEAGEPINMNQWNNMKDIKDEIIKVSPDRVILLLLPVPVKDTVVR